MSNQLTKEQISKLSPEQQLVVGKIALEDARKHRALLAAAKGNRGINYGSAAIIVIGYCVYSFTPGPLIPDSDLLLPILALLAVLLIQGHALAINSRIDALIKLLDLENRSHQNENESDFE